MKKLASKVSVGDVVHVIKNLCVIGIPEHRTGLIIDIKPSKNDRVVDVAYVMFPDQCRTFHVCHLRKLFL